MKVRRDWKLKLNITVQLRWNKHVAKKCFTYQKTDIVNFVGPEMVQNLKIVAIKANDTKHLFNNLNSS